MRIGVPKGVGGGARSATPKRTSKSSGASPGSSVVLSVVPSALHFRVAPRPGSIPRPRACGRTCGRLIIISACCDIPKSTDHHTRPGETPHSRVPSFLLSSGTPRSSVAPPPIISFRARLCLLTERSLITMSGGFDSSLMERRQPPFLPFPCTTIMLR